MSVLGAIGVVVIHFIGEDIDICGGIVCLAEETLVEYCGAGWTECAYQSQCRPRP